VLPQSPSPSAPAPATPSSPCVASRSPNIVARYCLAHPSAISRLRALFHRRSTSTVSSDPTPARHCSAIWCGGSTAHASTSHGPTPLDTSLWPQAARHSLPRSLTASCQKRSNLRARILRGSQTRRPPWTKSTSVFLKCSDPPPPPPLASGRALTTLLASSPTSSKP
jgi:hypothetical protein